MDLDFLEQQPQNREQEVKIGFWIVPVSFLFLILPSLIWTGIPQKFPEGHWHMTNVVPGYPEIVSIDFNSSNILINKDTDAQYPKFAFHRRGHLMLELESGKLKDCSYTIRDGNLFLYDKEDMEKLFSVGYRSNKYHR